MEEKMNRRITDHPILGPEAECEWVTVYVDNEPIQARKGEMIAAALMATGRTYFRKTVKHHEMRGLYCGIGRCTDCVMTVNGVPNVRTCVTEVQEGMHIETQIGNGSWKAI